MIFGNMTPDEYLPALNANPGGYARKIVAVIVRHFGADLLSSLLPLRGIAWPSKRAIVASLLRGPRPHPPYDP